MKQSKIMKAISFLCLLSFIPFEHTESCWILSIVTSQQPLLTAGFKYNHEYFLSSVFCSSVKVFIVLLLFILFTVGKSYKLRNVIPNNKSEKFPQNLQPW